MAQHYDIIGDIHGCNNTLISMLEALGYAKKSDYYQHPNRKVIFVGDFIDRGPLQLETIRTVRAMVAANQAHAVMGNHEFNAIAYITPDKVEGGYLRAHTSRNRRNHRAFLQAMEQHPEQYEDVINWFKTLPLWLDLGNLRIVHACWDQLGIDQISETYSADGLMDEALFIASNDPSKWEFHVVENLLKGKTIKLLNNHTFTDPNGITRDNMRIRWWDNKATTYKSAFMGAARDIEHINDTAIDTEHLIIYEEDEVPLLIGHYWMQDEPALLAPNIACVDYSIAKRNGKLCAYRWDGESKLDSAKFICVPRLES
ncbi:metallophosphoesterase [Leucothrix arctica]|uniref:Metallophosphoesterase n=1 Tax=Leucothrix arctica TaxID=1481894 RepID=A0A317CCZ4_9GAMM|nr:metallophosphoesterase [Leucothrix arctica]PWQ96257.1 metallophosphoesterase [Leucothrix arctica]